MIDTIILLILLVYFFERKFFNAFLSACETVVLMLRMN